MLARIVLALGLIALTSCESESEPNLEEIIKGTENFSEEQQAKTLVDECNNSANSEEVSITFSALISATSAENCNGLGTALIGTQELDLSGANILDLSPLRNMSSLTILNLSNNRIEQINSLTNLRNLSSLDISNNALTDIEPISDLVSLANLNLSRNSIISVDPLSRLLNLLSLDISFNNVETIANLKELRKLVTFEFSDNPLGTILDKSASNCPFDLNSAQVVRTWCYGKKQVPTFIQYCLDYDNLEPDLKKTVDTVKGFKTCEETDAFLAEQQVLDLALPPPPSPEEPDFAADRAAWLAQYGDQRLTNAAPFASLTHLIELNLNGHNVTNLEPISYLTNLKSLKMTYNEFSDITALSSLTNLIVLDVSGNQVSDISVVSQMSTLTGLVANHNMIIDLTPVANLSFLAGMGMQYNQINNLSPIKDLTQLFVLSINNNQIPSLAPLAGLVTLTNLQFLGNPIPQDEANCPILNVGPLLTGSCSAYRGLAPPP